MPEAVYIRSSLIPTTNGIGFGHLTRLLISSSNNGQLWCQQFLVTTNNAGMGCVSYGPQGKWNCWVIVSLCHLFLQNDCHFALPPVAHKGRKIPVSLLCTVTFGIIQHPNLYQPHIGRVLSQCNFHLYFLGD